MAIRPSLSTHSFYLPNPIEDVLVVVRLQRTGENRTVSALEPGFPLRGFDLRDNETICFGELHETIPRMGCWLDLHDCGRERRDGCGYGGESASSGCSHCGV